MQGNRNRKLPLSMLQWDRYPVRTCRSLHHCEVCFRDIDLGQKYRDGGYSRRAHVACLDRIGSGGTDSPARDAVDSVPR
jgi:hypothetical protein